MNDRKKSRVRLWVTVQVLVLMACVTTVYVVAYAHTTIGETGIALVTFLLGVSITAFCIWLAVRILNRREKWAIWTAVALPVPLYVLGIFPARWVHVNKLLPPWADEILDLSYSPLVWFLGRFLPI